MNNQTKQPVINVLLFTGISALIMIKIPYCTVSLIQTKKRVCMCGRFTLGKKPNEISDYFESHFDYTISTKILDKFAFKFNIPPSSIILSLRYNNKNSIECHPVRWGLVPSWSQGIDKRFSMNNARADTIGSKPAFRTAFKQQRCLIIADGFYEWHNQAGVKQPYYITTQNRGIFTFAGVWEQWIAPDQSYSIQSCSIITTEARSFMSKIHSRMPVIISDEFQHDWLLTKQTSDHLDKIQSLLLQSDYSLMQYYAVNKTVNSTSNDYGELLKPLDCG